MKNRAAFVIKYSFVLLTVLLTGFLTSSQAHAFSSNKLTYNIGKDHLANIVIEDAQEFTGIIIKAKKINGTNGILAPITFEYKITESAESSWSKIGLFPDEVNPSEISSMYTIVGNGTETFVHLELRTISELEDNYELEVHLINNNNQNFQSTAAATKNVAGVNVISRSGWGCGDYNPTSNYYCDDPFWKSSYNDPTHIVVHHTATSNSASNWAAEVRAIWYYHSHVRDADPNDGVQGWTDIGYNYLIDPNGVIYEGRNGGEGVTAGHAYLHNRGTVGIALIGNYSSRNITPAMRNSLIELTSALSARYDIDPYAWSTDAAGLSNQGLSGHRNWQATSCPGQTFYNTLNDVRAIVNQRRQRKSIDYTQSENCPKGYVRDGIECKQTRIESFGSSNATYKDILIHNSVVYALEDPGNVLNTFDGSGNALATYNLPEQIYKVFTNPNNGSILASAESGSFYELDATDPGNSLNNVAAGAKIDRVFPGSNASEMTLFSSSANTLLRLDNFTSVSQIINPDYANAAVKLNNGNYMLSIAGKPIIKVYDSSGAEVREIALPGSMIRDLVIQDDNVLVLLLGSREIYRINQTNYTSSKLLTTPKTPEKFGELHLGNNQYLTLHPSIVSKIQGGNFSKIYSSSVNKSVADTTNSQTLLIGDFAGIRMLSLNDSSAIPQTMTLYRFWSEQSKKHFYSKGSGERDYVLNTFPSNVWRYETPGFVAFANTNSQPNLKPVYRFWSDTYKSHFYTIDYNEKTYIENNFSTSVWRYEFVAFYAYTSQVNGTLPVYRFWSDRNKGHFFTISEAERNEVVNNFPLDIWRYESIAFYAYPV